MAINIGNSRADWQSATAPYAPIDAREASRRSAAVLALELRHSDRVRRHGLPDGVRAEDSDLGRSVIDRVSGRFYRPGEATKEREVCSAYGVRSPSSPRSDHRARLVRKLSMIHLRQKGNSVTVMLLESASQADSWSGVRLERTLSRSMAAED